MLFCVCFNIFVSMNAHQKHTLKKMNGNWHGHVIFRIFLLLFFLAVAAAEEVGGIEKRGRENLFCASFYIWFVSKRNRNNICSTSYRILHVEHRIPFRLFAQSITLLTVCTAFCECMTHLNFGYIIISSWVIS